MAMKLDKTKNEQQANNTNFELYMYLFAVEYWVGKDFNRSF